MTKPRVGYFAFALPVGAVLVIGGDQRFLAPITAQEYDPLTGVWTPAGQPGPMLKFHIATMLPSGEIFVTGAGAASWLYDPAAAAGSYAGSLNVAHECHTATLPDDGAVLVVGGWGDAPSGHAALDSAEIYGHGDEFKAQGSGEEIIDGVLGEPPLPGISWNLERRA